MVMRTLLTVCLMIGLLSSCATSDQISRRRGDVLQTGRRISPVAYAWYVRGRHNESMGNFSRAERDYRAALRSDPRSGASWAALGRITCRHGFEPARRLFERGLRKADRKAPILKEQGRCRIAHADESRQRISRACKDLRQALRLEPDKREMSDVYAACLSAAGRGLESSRVKRAARLYLGRLPSSPRAPSLEVVDQALRAGDLPAAQDAALTLMNPGTLAARAVLVGQPELAKEQAQLVLSASPSDPDANVTMMALREGDIRPPETLEDLSAPGIVLLVQVLRRHVSIRVSESFFHEYRDQLADTADPLVKSFVTRPESTETSGLE